MLIIDDETYVCLDPENAPGKKYFHSSDPSSTKYEDKVKPQCKFPKKFLIWQAMSQDGQVSEPFITDKTLTSEVYLEECVKK